MLKTTFVVFQMLGLAAMPAVSVRPALAQAGGVSVLSSDDKDFLKKAAQGNHAEIATGKIALQKAQNPEVKKFAQHMIEDHTKGQQKLMKLAAAKGVSLPGSESLTMKAQGLKLKALSGSSFDKSYVDLMVDDHNEDLTEFRKEKEAAQDSDVKRFASDMVSTLKGHQKTIQELKGKLVAGTAEN